MANLAFDLDEHRPTRLVGMPVQLAAQLAHKSPLQRLEQRCQRLQPAGQRARRQVQSMIGQVLQQAMTRAAVQEFIQQHADPHRYAKLAPLDQPCWGRCCHDTGHTSALAVGSITSPADHAPVGLNLDLQHLAVLSAGEIFQRLAAVRALRRVELNELGVLGQVRQHRASMTRRTAPLASGCTRSRGLGLLLVPALAALALASKHALLQIADLCLRQFQFTAQRRFALPSPLLQLAQHPLISAFTPLRSRHRSCVQALPALGIHHKLDVLLLGQRHEHCGKRRRLRTAHQ